jgi:hypothetical protein
MELPEMLRPLPLNFKTWQALAMMAVLLTARGNAASSEDPSNYVVSWSGRYIFAAVDSQQDPPVHRVFVTETTHPDLKSVIGDDYQGKGFAGVYCSKDDRWLCVNLGVGVHGAECHVFKHIVERRFDELNTADINAKIKSSFESSAGPGFTFDAAYGEYWKEDSLVLLASGRGQKEGNFYDDQMFLEYQPATGQFSALSKHFVSPTGAGPGEKVDPEYVSLENAVLKAYEESLQHQIDLIYALLLQKLDAVAKAKLVSEQKQWALERDEKPPGRYERDSFVQQRINTLAAKFLSLH